MKASTQTTLNGRNLLLLSAVLLWGGVLLFLYRHLLHASLVLWALVSVLAGAYVAAFEASTRRLALLVAIAAAAGYLAHAGGRHLGGMWAFVERQHAGHFVTVVFVLAALVAYPVHFGIIDAFVGADGPFGIFADQHPNPTHTMIAGENILAVDWVGASKMGLDPMQSRYMQLAVQAFGQPHVELVGDGSVYPGWRNVPKPLIEFWDHAEESTSFTSTVFAILNRDYMSPAFPRRPMPPWPRVAQRLLGRLGGMVYAVPPVPERPAHAKEGDDPRRGDGTG